MGLFNIVEFRNLEFRPGHNHNLSLLPAKHTFLNPVERTISSDFLHLHLNKMFLLRCCLIVLSSTTYLSSGFTFVPFVPIPALHHRSTKNFSAVSSDTPSSPDSFFEEEAIVKSVKKSQLQTLCRQMNLPQIGTKKELFLRLKGHVNQIQSQSSSQSQYYDSSSIVPPPTPPPPNQDPKPITTYSSDGRNDLTSSTPSNSFSLDSPIPPPSPSPSLDLVSDPSDPSADPSSSSLAKSHVAKIESLLVQLLETTTQSQSQFSPQQISAGSLQEITAPIIFKCGESLEVAIRNVEVKAIGEDGLNADDRSKGGERAKRASLVTEKN